MKLDLHIHTDASDGVCSPAEVVRRALVGGLDVISITDHDTVAGIRMAQEATKGEPIEVVPGIELSSTHEGAEVHILAYGVDLDARAIEDHRRRSRERREQRLREMLERLSLQGVPVLYREVEVELGSDEVAPARPHLARALVKKGFAASVPDAFARLIGDDAPAFVSTDVATPAEAVRVAQDSGGIAVWAHPPVNLLEDLLPSLVEQGLRGLEVYRPRNQASLIRRLVEQAERFDLFLTGGSDWHGPYGRKELGDFFVSDREIAPFLDALAL